MILKSVLVAILLVGAPVLTNNVLFMDGNFDYVEVPDSPSLSNLPELTVEAWIHPFSGFFPTNGIENVAAQYSSAAGERAYFLAWKRSDGRMRASVNEFTGGTFIDGNLVVPADAWTHVAATHDGQALSIYVNGQLDVSVSMPISGIIEIDQPIRFGAQAGSNTNWFPGLEDDVRIWAVARSEAQILAGMDGLMAGDNQGLLGYWRMNNRTPGVEDSYIHANHGTLNGDAELIGLDQVPKVLPSGAEIPVPFGPLDASGNG